MTASRPKLVKLILDNSLLLLAGTVASIACANVDLPGYTALTRPLHFWVNDVGMGSSLHGQRRRYSRPRCRAGHWPR
jgi:hypothetical protein